MKFPGSNPLHPSWTAVAISSISSNAPWMVVARAAASWQACPQRLVTILLVMPRAAHSLQEAAPVCWASRCTEGARPRAMSRVRRLSRCTTIPQGDRHPLVTPGGPLRAGDRTAAWSSLMPPQSRCATGTDRRLALVRHWVRVCGTTAAPPREDEGNHQRSPLAVWAEPGMARYGGAWDRPAQGPSVCCPAAQGAMASCAAGCGPLPPPLALQTTRGEAAVHPVAPVPTLPSAT